MKDKLKNLDRGVQNVLRILCILIFIVLGLLLLSNVMLRLVNDLSVYLTGHGYEAAGAAVKGLFPMVSFHWFDEIVELCFASLVFYGAAALWGTKGHFSVGDWISSRLPNDAARGVYKLIVTGICVAFLGIFFWYSFQLTVNSTELTTVFQIPKSLLYSCMPVSSFIMLMYSLVDLYLDIKMIGAKPGEHIDMVEQKSQSL